VPVTVTLSFYSGRANPSWQLPGDQVIKLREMLAHARLSGAEGAVYRGGLGYSGFVVDAGDDDTIGRFLICDGAISDVGSLTTVADKNHAIERWLFGCGAAHLTDVMRGEVNRLLATLKVAPMYRHGVICKEKVPAGVAGVVPPAWDPDLWNNSSYLLQDNCYNYANDLLYDVPRSAKVAEPGFGFPGGKPCKKDPCGCGGYGTAARSDKLQRAPDFKRTQGMVNEWFVALFTGQGPYAIDSHWYRQDGNGFWSHKPGKQRARNCDESGQLISDPKAADTNHFDHGRPMYTFCHFFKTGPNVKIGSRP